jgi:membrane-associated PAP2 superfamily phosphatase
MNFSQLPRRWRELLVWLVLVSITTPVFWLTDLDYRVAALFYGSGTGEAAWPLGQWWLWRGLFVYAPSVLVAAAIGALLVAVSSFGWTQLTPLRRPALYILLVIALGPGLMVNLVFKDHWGRPRPLHTSEFGGNYQYIPPLEIGHTKDKSFPCGHCSVGYALFALYFLARKRKALYFALTMAAALALALARMAAGGHFLSDVLWSGYVVFLVAWLVYYGWYGRNSR